MPSSSSPRCPPSIPPFGIFSGFHSRCVCGVLHRDCHCGQSRSSRASVIRSLSGWCLSGASHRALPWELKSVELSFCSRCVRGLLRGDCHCGQSRSSCASVCQSLGGWCLSGASHRALPWELKLVALRFCSRCVRGLLRGDCRCSQSRSSRASVRWSLGGWCLSGASHRALPWELKSVALRMPRRLRVGSPRGCFRGVLRRCLGRCLNEFWCGALHGCHCQFLAQCPRRCLCWCIG